MKVITLVVLIILDINNFSPEIEAQMDTISKNHNRTERGQSLVELGVSLVILLILLAGVVDFGRLAFHYLSMHDAAQEGASYGSIFPHETKEIMNRVKAGLVIDDLSRITINVKLYDDGDEETPKFDCNSNEDCANYGFKEFKEAGIAIEVDDIMEITVIDSGFPLDMPFFGGTLLNIKSTIKDNVIRVPTSPQL